jgi:hypothetical protein
MESAMKVNRRMSMFPTHLNFPAKAKSRRNLTATTVIDWKNDFLLFFWVSNDILQLKFVLTELTKIYLRK